MNFLKHNIKKFLTYTRSPTALKLLQCFRLSLWMKPIKKFSLKFTIHTMTHDRKNIILKIKKWVRFKKKKLHLPKVLVVKKLSGHCMEPWRLERTCRKNVIVIGSFVSAISAA